MAHPAPLRIKIRAPRVDATARTLQVKASIYADLKKSIAASAGRSADQTPRKGKTLKMRLINKCVTKASRPAKR